MKEFFRRLFIVLKGGEPCLDDNEPIKTEKDSNDSIIFTEPASYLYLDE